MYRIYLDLDGCFANFHKRVRQVYKDDWSDKIWPIIDKVPNLFSELELMDGAKPAFDEILTYGYPVEILTALPKPTHQLVSAPKDKIAWVRNNLHPTIQVNCSFSWKGKLLWVAPNHILIDDMTRNIDAWNDAGGIGIKHSGDWEDTLDKLRAVVL